MNCEEQNLLVAKGCVQKRGSNVIRDEPRHSGVGRVKFSVNAIHLQVSGEILCTIHIILSQRQNCHLRTTAKQNHAVSHKARQHT